MFMTVKLSPSITDLTEGLRQLMSYFSHKAFELSTTASYDQHN